MRPEPTHAAASASAAPAWIRIAVPGWLGDFVFERGRVWSRKTGASLPLDGRLLRDVLVWVGFHLRVRIQEARARARAPGLRLWFAPDRPRPWYLVWSAAVWAGVRLVDDPARADAAFAFEDAVHGAAPAPAGLRVLNGGCVDISKSHVGEVFERVFGYPLAIDPETWVGPAVEKSEANGLHDGRVVQCPTPRRAGRAYQRLVDAVEGGLAVDLRTPCVGGRAVVVWRKRRPVETRFDIYNTDVVALGPEDVFSPAELDALGRFCSAMGLDWGGLDVLRDVGDGRLYVVDVNKTDVGPVLALPWHDKVRSVAALGRALRALLENAPATP